MEESIKERIAALKERIRIREMADDMYYLSSQCRKDEDALFALNQLLWAEKEQKS